MNLLEGGFPLRRTPCLVLPDTMVVSAPIHSLAYPDKVTVRIWLDAVWASPHRGGFNLTYGTLNDGYGASRNLGRDVRAVDVARKFQPARFNDAAARAIRFDGATFTGYRVQHPRRARQIAALLREIATLVAGAPEQGAPDLPAGALGWYALTPA